MGERTADLAPTMKRGFYPDPENADRLRWWTGKQWGTSTAAPGSQPVAPKPATRYRAWINVALLIIAILVISTIVTQNFGH